MRPEIIARLNAINRAFYATTAAQFDQTRARAWAGWEQLLPFVRPLGQPSAPLAVLDAGCGNGRFGRWLAGALGRAVAYHGQDSSPQLLVLARSALADVPGLHATLEVRDIVTHPPDTGAYDLVALFGVMHHVPGAGTRRALLRALAERVQPGGALVWTAWRFLDSPRLAARIVPWGDDLAGEVEPGDHLLDWRRGEPALRYCHYVDDAEHAALVRASGLDEIASYRADGENGALNRYSVLSKPSSAGA